MTQIVHVAPERWERLGRAYPTVDSTHVEALSVPGGMQMTEPALGDARALRRFRVALTAAEAAPSAASVAALRQAVVPLKNQLRTAYVAAGSPYGDDSEGLYRWIREVIARRDGGAAEMPSDGSMSK
jgi:hypothetical protein